MVRVGDRVRVERDEVAHPSRGTWPRYRGKVGIVRTINRTDNEVGVMLTDGHESTWFKPWELVVVEPRRRPRDAG